MGFVDLAVSYSPIACAVFCIGVAVVKLVPGIGLTGLFRESCLAFVSLGLWQDEPEDTRVLHARTWSGALDITAFFLCFAGFQFSFLLLPWIALFLWALLGVDILVGRAASSTVPLLASPVFVVYFVVSMCAQAALISWLVFIISIVLPFGSLVGFVAYKIKEHISHSGRFFFDMSWLTVLIAGLTYLLVSVQIIREMTILSQLVWWTCYTASFMALGRKYSFIATFAEMNSRPRSLHLSEFSVLLPAIPISWVAAVVLDYCLFRFGPILIRLVIASFLMFLGIHKLFNIPRFASFEHLQMISKRVNDNIELFGSEHFLAFRISLGVCECAAASIVLVSSVSLKWVAYLLAGICVSVINFSYSSGKREGTCYLLLLAPACAVLILFFWLIVCDMSMIWNVTTFVLVLTLLLLARRLRQKREEERLRMLKKQEEEKAEMRRQEIRKKFEKDEEEAKKKRQDEIIRKCKEIELQARRGAEFFLRYIYETFPLQERHMDSSAELKTRMKLALSHYHPDRTVAISIHPDFANTITCELNRLMHNQSNK